MGSALSCSSILTTERVNELFWVLAQIAKDIEKRRNQWKEDYKEGFKQGWREGRKELIWELIEQDVSLPASILAEGEYRPNEPSRN